MPQMQVTKAIGPAFEHMATVLTRPLVFKKWLALGFIAIFAYGGAGGIHFNGGMPGSQHEQRQQRSSSAISTHFASTAPVEGRSAAPLVGEPSVSVSSPFPGVAMSGFPIDDVCPGLSAWVSGHVPLVIAGAILLLVLGFVMSWLSSVFSFVYVEDIARNTFGVKEPFHRLKGLGNSYFLWKLAFGFVGLLIIAIIAIPILTTAMGSSGFGSLGAIILMSLVAILVVICMAVIEVFARDFVVPAMYAKNLKVSAGWREVLTILRANPGQTFIFLLLQLVFAVAGGICAAIIGLLVAIVFLIPAALLFAIGYGIYSIGGSATTIYVFGAIVGVPWFLGLLWFSSSAAQPVYVFLRSFPMIVLGQTDESLTTIDLQSAPQTAAEVSE